MNEADFSKAAYQEHLNQHKLMGSRCRSCGTLFLPPRALCMQCFSQELAWEELAPRGRLAAFTVVHIAPTAMIAAGYGRENPYCTGIVALEQGPSISAQILGVDVWNPEGIKIGTWLKGEFLERGAGETQQTFLAFRVEA